MVNKFKSIPVIFIMISMAACLFPALDLFAAAGSQDFISICNRTEPVRIAIQKEVALQRFTSGTEGDVRCYAIRPSELKKIESIQMVEKEISSLKAGDFAGLDALKMLDLEGNKIKIFDPSVFSDLHALEYLILARNPLTALGNELAPFTNLKRVDFSDCKLSWISATAFSANKKLEAVFISGNSLKELPEGIFSRNNSLRIIDLAGNRLKQLPSFFLPDQNGLKSLDLSQNMIEKISGDQGLKLKELRVINLSGNPVEDLNNRESLGKIFDASTEIITSHDDPSAPDKNKFSDSDWSILDSQNHIYQSTEKLRGFVRNHWRLPLDIKIIFSNGGQFDLRNPGQRAAEERLLFRQLEEIREAYRRAAFDFFEVQIRFIDPAASQKTPALSFNKKQIGMAITLSADCKKPDAPCLITDDQILELLADNFSRSHSIRWFPGESPQDLESALKRDFEKVGRMDDELHFDIMRFDDLIDTAMERSRETHEKDFFSNSELIDARFIQFRVMLTFQRLENTIARWKLAESDSGFPYRSEVRMLLSEASEVYRTNLDWFINTIVGGRATINILDKTWYHRNPIFKILDSEVPAGFFNLDGRISTRIPGGAVRDLLESRLSLPLLHFLHRTRSVDEKVSANDINKSPLGAQMIQAKERIRKNRQTFKSVEISYLRSFKELWDARIKNSVKFPLYHVVVGVAGWIGDTRLSHPSPAITDEQINDMKAHLKPGDILIERTDYYLSNAFLGGFWPHGILYLGPREEWSGMRLSDGTTLAEDHWIAEHILPNYRSEKDGRQALVMEAISEGVVFNSLEEAAQKDYIAVFRPKFSPHEQEGKIAGIIKRALKYHGRPYDFDFDFFTDDKLVCTELLYRAYHPDINFLIQKEAVKKPNPPIPGMIRKAGRDTMPAGEIVKLALYMLDHNEPDPSIGYEGRMLEFVRLYMKQGKGQPAQIFEGEQGIQILRRSLKQ